MSAALSYSTDRADVLGDYRLTAILQSLAHAAKLNIWLSEELAISGAMRWPMSMRPEVVVVTSVDIH